MNTLPKKHTAVVALILIAAAWSLHSCAPYGASLTTIKDFSELQYPFATKYAQLTVQGNAVRVAYIDEGPPNATETIVFIHGLGSYLPAWKKNVEVLRSQYRCIAIDLPGYGKSSKNPQFGASTPTAASYPHSVYPYSMTFFADVVAALLEERGLANATLCGHSMGGQISMTTALHHPQRVKNLILVDPAGFEGFTEGEKQWFREVVTATGTKLTPPTQIRANLMGNFYDFYGNAPDAEFMITDRIAMRSAQGFDQYCYAIVKSVQAMVDQPVLDRLSQISQPTLVFFGEQDNLIPNPFLHGGFTSTVAESGAAKIPRSRLVMVPNAGHFAQFERPDIVNQSIREFLK